jgi:histone deacetylase complex regulatory component SIN3
MKNRKCPSHKACLDYDNGNCENCVFGETIIKLYKRIDRLKKQNETLTIQRNAWALAAKAVKEDTVREMQEKVEKKILEINPNLCGLLPFIDQIAKEMLEGKNAQD